MHQHATVNAADDSVVQSSQRQQAGKAKLPQRPVRATAKATSICPGPRQSGARLQQPAIDLLLEAQAWVPAIFAEQCI